MSNGDRRIFFQDVSGFIRESIYTASTENWTANVNNVVATDAKNFTPLAAINFVSLDATPTLDKVFEIFQLLVGINTKSAELAIDCCILYQHSKSFSFTIFLPKLMV